MLRAAVTAAALVIGIAAAAAQQDPIAERKALMKATGQQAAAGAAMVKGEAPFDLAKAQAVLAQYQETSAKAANLFPPTSKTGGETAALPKIWETKVDFETKLAKLGADAKAASGQVKDLDSFKTAFGGVMKNCGGCHEDYRAKKQ
jgi:cytochrome c556